MKRTNKLPWYVIVGGVVWLLFMLASVFRAQDILKENGSTGWILIFCVPILYAILVPIGLWFLHLLLVRFPQMLIRSERVQRRHGLMLLPVGLLFLALTAVLAMWTYTQMNQSLLFLWPLGVGLYGTTEGIGILLLGRRNVGIVGFIYIVVIGVVGGILWSCQN